MSYYEHYYDAFGRECLQAGYMRAAMHARATAVMSAAISMAPVDTGEYVDSFSTSDGIGPYGGRGLRAYGRVTNSAPHALYVEFGFGRVPRYRVLGRALGAVGTGKHVDVDANVGQAKVKGKRKRIARAKNTIFS